MKNSELLQDVQLLFQLVYLFFRLLDFDVKLVLELVGGFAGGELVHALPDPDDQHFVCSRELAHL
ncbi:hypothetical protein J0A68_07795 [Algoriphagus sp. H41]|uniref:Uncharacterized protein n=1 Tax=Algoriphagus oliviformis TaxID=2811231 RepID=A0ABS3C161_9BACT|nr:hypothetical protein [Algoriphagus oliviformis]MBN7810852.1 hypothetical protein [Algoriphagus oliviformis]